MFRMTIDDVMAIGNNISFAGSCENKNEFKPRLTDSSGNVYETYMPLGVSLVLDDSRIMLAMKGEYDIKTLKGLSLIAAD